MSASALASLISLGAASRPKWPPVNCSCRWLHAGLRGVAVHALVLVVVAVGRQGASCAEAKGGSVFVGGVLGAAGADDVGWGWLATDAAHINQFLQHDRTLQC